MQRIRSAYHLILTSPSPGSPAQDLDCAEFQCSAAPTPVGQQALAALQRLIYGQGGPQGPALPHQALQGSLHQARVSRDLCIATLIDSVTPETCLSLMALAASTGCAPLLRRCEACATRHFSAALLADMDGLVALPETQLLALLSSDELRVGDELDVFTALNAWIEHDLPQRLPSFVDLFTKTLRFGQLTLDALIFLVEKSPLVALEMRALKLAAHALIQYYIGAAADGGLGRGTVNRPRACQLKAAEGSAAVVDAPADADADAERPSVLRCLLRTDEEQSEMERRASSGNESCAAAPAAVDKENCPEDVPGFVGKPLLQVVCELGLLQGSGELGAVMCASPSRALTNVLENPNHAVFCGPPDDGGARRELQW